MTTASMGRTDFNQFIEEENNMSIEPKGMKMKLYYQDKLLFDGGRDFAVDGNGKIMLLDPTTGGYFVPKNQEDYKIDPNIFTY